MLEHGANILYSTNTLRQFLFFFVRPLIIFSVLLSCDRDTPLHDGIFCDLNFKEVSIFLISMQEYDRFNLCVQLSKIRSFDDKYANAGAKNNFSL